MSLLSIVQSAAPELSLPTPSAVAASTDPQVVLLFRLAKEEGMALAARHTWQNLTTEKTFTTTAAAIQVGAIPTDFDRMIPETFFNRTTNKRVVGPIDPVEWQRIQSSLVTLVNPAFRIRGSSILITPTPSAGQTCAYEYVSTKWCASSGGTAQNTWAADTDVTNICTNTVLAEEAMTLGIIWRFRKAKGLDFTADLQAYERYVTDLIMNDGSRPRLQSSVPTSDRVPVPPQVPDTLVL